MKCGWQFKSITVYLSVLYTRKFTLFGQKLNPFGFIVHSEYFIYSLSEERSLKKS